MSAGCRLTASDPRASQLATFQPSNLQLTSTHRQVPVSPRTYGFGLIGAGVIAPTHCKAVHALPNARLVACCDLERPKAEKLAAEYEIPHVCGDYHELLRRDDVDVVEIVTWSGVHAEIGM